MADRREFQDVKINTDDILDVDVKDEDLKDLDLGDDLVHDDDLLDDDFAELTPTPRKRKGKSNMTLWVLILLVLVAGGGFVAMNQDILMRLMAAGSTDAVSMDTASMLSPATPSAPMTAETPVPPPVADTAAAPVATPPSSAADFTDLPQPVISSVETPEPAVATAPESVTPAPVADTPKPEATTTTIISDEPEPTKPAVASPATPAEPATPVAANPPATTDPLPPPPSVDTAVAPEFVDTNAPPSVPAADVGTTTPPVPVTKPDVTPSTPAATPAAPAAVAKTDKEEIIIDDDEEPLPKYPPGQEPKDLVDMTPPTPTTGPLDTTKADQYLESLEPTQEIARAMTPRLNIPADQMDRNLGVTVTQPGAKPAEPMNAGAATNTSPNPEGKISAASRALELGRYQAALEMFDDLYKTNKLDERILMGRAVALQKLDRNDEAIKAYDELLGLNPSSPEVMTNMLGLVRKQYPSAALQRLVELRQRYPNNAVVAAQTGLANAGVGNFDEGLRYLGIAAGLEPENPKHPFNMAVIAERMGKADLAITYYERALKADALVSDPRDKVNRDLVYDRLSRLRQH